VNDVHRCIEVLLPLISWVQRPGGLPVVSFNDETPKFAIPQIFGVGNFAPVFEFSVLAPNPWSTIQENTSNSEYSTTVPGTIVLGQQ
jgi:hypothetical protein